MHITAACPFCQTHYQVQPSLRGQPIRCPNPTCRKIFMIAADPPSEPAPGGRPPPPTENGPRSGTVGEMVPILPAEAAPPAAKPADGAWWQTPPPVRQSTVPSASAPPAPVPAQPAPAAPAAPAPQEAPWWGDAPPPVRQPQAPPPPQAAPTQRLRRPEANAKTSAKPARERAASTETQKMPALEPEAPDQPREMPPGEWEPPPVRRGPAEVGATETMVATESADTHAPRVSKRHAWRFIVLFFLFVAGILGAGGYYAYTILQQSEGNVYNQATEELRDGKYSAAAAKFHDLAERFGNSDKHDEYSFLAEWTDLLSKLSLGESEVGEAADQLDQFLKDHKNDPFMEPNASHAGKALVQLAQRFAESNSNPQDSGPLEVAQHIETVRKTVESFGPDALSKSDSEQIGQALGTVRAAVARWRERQEVLDLLRPRPQEPLIRAIQRAERIVAEKTRLRPGFDQDEEIKAAIEKLYQDHFASVVYQPRKEAERRRSPPRSENLDEEKAILFDPLLPGGSPGSAPEGDPIVLALARGVLYALKRSNGEIQWATRVGIDTTVLPERVPASQVSRERLLVLSADTQTLTAFDTNGGILWEYHIGQPVLGRPVIIKQRAYLAAYDGWVHEIELAEGNLIGRYNLGQPLTRGGAHEAGTNRIYFPADDSCVFVLDVAERRCVNILYDGHPSGSLRSEPVVIPPEGEGTPGYLILNQTSGLDAMRLRVFKLPLENRHAAPMDLNPPARISGWTWFEPYNDGEKLAVLSDAGILGLFGIRQAGNLDQALFPLLQPGGLDLSPLLLLAGEDKPLRGRSQVVQIQGDDLWVLAHGRLQQIQLRFSNAAGPKPLPGWTKPLMLGSPLHAPQSVMDRTGLSTFYLVTQPLEQQICLATAVNDEGKLLWQRQLGLVCQGEPLALTPPEGGPPLLLTLDQGGGLFTLDAPQPPDRPRTNWESIAPALDDNPRFPPLLLPAPDGQSVYEIAAPGKAESLIVRHIEWAQGERRLVVTQRKVSLAPVVGGRRMFPQGTPAVVGAQLIVPMSEGYIARVPLPIPENASFESGPDWRARQAPANAPGYVLALGGDRFLTTDGGRNLAVWEWPSEKSYQPLPAGRDIHPTLEMDNRVSAPPLLLPAKPGTAPQVLVADSAGVLHLLALAADGLLQRSRKWELKGQFTTGPFVRKLADGSVRIGCVIDQQRLVWLDPSQPDKPLWTYPTNGEAIVGQPQVIEDMLVLAFQSGLYVGIDLKTGKEKGPGYKLSASVAPAATPVSFGPGVMFTPLSDGTALPLPLKLLREPKGEE